MLRICQAAYANVNKQCVFLRAEGYRKHAHTTMAIRNAGFGAKVKINEL